MNLYFLLGFVLIACVSFAVMRALHVSRIPAVVASVLYAVLPYHLMRAEHHLFLGAYWIVPLAVLVCMWLVHSPALVFRDQGSWRPLLRDRRTLISLGICVLLGASGIYYAFFACFLMLVAGIVAAVRARSGRRVLASAILVLAVCLSVGAGLAEGLAYQAKAGPNPDVAQRQASDADLYGLRLAQMLLPVADHRVPLMAKARRAYRGILETQVGGGVNENESATLGAVFSLGFVGLCGVALFGSERLRRSRFGTLSALCLSSFLLATVSGFGLIFAMAISPQIRAYTRISVFIAFLCATGIALALDVLRRRIGEGWSARLGFPLLCAALLVVGILDQTPVSIAPDHAAAASVFRGDAAYVARVESLLPEDAMVFQLPYVPFPESGPVESFPDYGHFRAYLHSKHTRWSYGAMRGRDTDVWQRDTANLAAPEFIEEIRAAGFDGVWVDLRGYADAGESILAELESVLGRAPLRSEDGTVAFFATRQ
jgi:phosphoglycerol transferase